MGSDRTPTLLFEQPLRLHSLFPIGLGCALALLSACNADSDGPDHVAGIADTTAPAGVALGRPAALNQLRVVDREALSVELELTYEQTVDVVTATRVGASDRWSASLTVPTGTPFSLSAIWYDTAGGVRLDLVTATRRFAPIGDPGTSSVVFDFDEFDSAEFDADADSLTNLQERLDGTDPFDATSPGVAPAPGSAVSRFDSDEEGWTLAGDTVEESPLWVPSATGGHICASDRGQGIYWYFRAPPQFGGNQIGRYGESLAFNLRAEPSTVDSEPLVQIRSGGRVLEFRTERLPGSDFTPFSVSLTEQGWSIDGVPVTVGQFSEALMSVDELLIRGEYAIGGDTGCLDDVVLGG